MYKRQGQKPVVTTAKKSVANFKVREGMKIGAKVTLRGDRMYEFIDKLDVYKRQLLSEPVFDIVTDRLQSGRRRTRRLCKIFIT